MKGKETLLVAAMLGLASGTASAAELGYDFIEAGYHELKWDDMVHVIQLSPTGPGSSYYADGSGSQFSLAGSWTITDSWFVSARFRDQEVSASVVGPDIEETIRRFELAVGGHCELAQATDLVAQVGAVRAERKAGDGLLEFNDTGYRATVGVRHLFNDAIEGFVHAGSEDLYDESHTIVQVGGRYAFSEQWSMVIDYLQEGDFATYGATARYSF